jgi:hypothetical protein
MELSQEPHPKNTVFPWRKYSLYPIPFLRLIQLCIDEQGRYSKVMVHKAVTVIIAAIYLLTPYVMSNQNARCQCGCQEFICYCCKQPENYGDVTSFSECRCNIFEESNVQSPAVIEYSWGTEFILDLAAHLMPRNKDSILSGYKEPPMKPPPTV